MKLASSLKAPIRIYSKCKTEKFKNKKVCKLNFKKLAVVKPWHGSVSADGRESKKLRFYEETIRRSKACNKFCKIKLIENKEIKI